MKCKFCGKEYEPKKKPGRKRLYCDDCFALDRDVRSGKVFDSRQVQVCEHCGVEYQRSHKTKYCTDECQVIHNQELWKEKRRTEEYKAGRETFKKTCADCGEEFETTTKTTSLCEKCHKKQSAERAIKLKEINLATKIDKICAWCGKPFQATMNNPDQKFCDNSNCSQAYHSRLKRARKRKAFVEGVYMNKLYKRDKGICGLCGEIVEKKYKHPHPLSASIDHITPLSKGGTHEYANVQLAHLQCNMIKGNRELDAII